MELYANLKGNTGTIVAVTYDDYENRVERKIFIEEEEHGHIVLIVKDPGAKPLKLPDSFFWR